MAISRDNINAYTDATLIAYNHSVRINDYTPSGNLVWYSSV